MNNLIFRLLPWTCLFIAMALPALAQNADNRTAQNDQAELPVHTIDTSMLRRAEEAPAPNQVLDLYTLIKSETVFRDQANDPVWQPIPQPGRQIIQIPIHVQPTDEITELRRPAIDLRGARFIAWRIESDQQDAQGQVDRHAEQPDLGHVGAAGLIVDGQIQRGEYSSLPQPGQRIENKEGPNRTVVPEDAPRITRQITVHPNNMIEWRMDRVISGAQLKDGTHLYLLKIDASRLRDARPEQPRREGSQNRQDARAAQAQMRDAERAYRQELNDYRQLTADVREAPDVFTQAMPERIWAIFEIPEHTDDLQFQGAEPLPWRVSIADLQQLRQISGRQVSRQADQVLDRETLNNIQLMQRWLDTKHPLAERSVAMATRDAQLVRAANVNDPIYRMLNDLLAVQDDVAGNMVLTDIATTIPPTQASTRLLAAAASRMSPTQQLAALTSLLSSNLREEETQENMGQTIHRTLADPKGPDVGKALDAVNKAVADDAMLRRAFGTQIDFATLPDARQQQAIAYIIEQAPYQRMPATWLNLNLLADDDLAKKTFQAIIKRYGLGDSQIASSDLPSPLLIRSNTDNLLKYLYGEDEALQSLAWQALPAFVIVDERGGSSSQHRTGNRPRIHSDGGRDISGQLSALDLVLGSAFDQDITPDTLITFLIDPLHASDKALEVDLGWHRPLNQPRTLAGALIDVALFSDSEQQEKAISNLFAHKMPFAELYSGMPNESQANFARILYEQQGEQGVITYLLASDDLGPQLSRWFSQQLEERSLQDLPQAGEWANALGDETRIIDLIAQQDNPEIIQALVVALVGTAGATESQGVALVPRFEEARKESADAVRSLWETERENVQRQRLQEAAGTYQIQLRVGPPDQFTNEIDRMQRLGQLQNLQPYTAPEGEDTEEHTLQNIPLGTVRLLIQGDTIKWSNDIVLQQASDGIGLVLDRPSELKTFDAAAVQDIPFETVTEAVTLHPAADGSWYALAQLSDGQVFELTMQPR